MFFEQYLNSSKLTPGPMRLVYTVYSDLINVSDSQVDCIKNYI